MPAVKIIRARGDGYSVPMGERHITFLPQEGHYITLRGKPYYVEAVIHALDRNQIIVRVRSIEEDPEPEPVQAPQLQVQQLPALPPSPEVQQQQAQDDDDWFYH